jgi:glycosyltransferase involved in cell wall biosynthesis
MLLSILIPMYNAEHYIGKCLGSLLQQDLSADAYEIIVMDDGSKDGSAQFVRDLAKDYPQIRLFSEANSGADATRNKMLKLAKGEYIYFVDADDYLCPNVLNSLVAYAQTKTLDVLAFDVAVTNVTEQMQPNKNPAKLEDVPIVNGEQFLLAHPKHRTEIWWYIVKASLLQENNIVFEKSKGNGDTIFTLKVFLSAKKVIFHPIIVYNYFLSPDSIMRSPTKEKKLQLVESLYLMLTDYIGLVEDLENKLIPCGELSLTHVKKRRGTSVLFFIHHLLRANVEYKVFKTYMRKLKNTDLYPIEIYISPEKNALKERAFNLFILNEYLLYPVSLLYRIKV